MGKKTKAFGELLKQEKRKAKNLTKPLPKFTALRKEEDAESYVESNCEEQEQRIAAIVGFDKDGEVLDVNAQTLATYRDYLEKHLTSPCYVTGIEDKVKLIESPNNSCEIYCRSRESQNSNNTLTKERETAIAI